MGLRINLVTFAAVFLLATFQGHASDPELTTDFSPPPPGVSLNADFFTFINFRNAKPNASSPFATVKAANTGNLTTGSATAFAALEGLGISSALIQFPPNTINRPHTHPRGTELLFVIEGCLDVGLLDTADNLFTQTLQAGDLFVFPKGLVHFQINWGKDGKMATALGSLSSSNPGTLILPPTLFGSKLPIDNEVLAKSFAVSVDVIKALKAAQ